MTAPTETPATGTAAPATAPTETVVPANDANPPATPATPTPPEAPAKGTDDGEDWKARARQWEERSKANHTALTTAQEKAAAAESRATAQTEQMAAIAKALGLTKGDEKPDPEAITKQLSDRVHSTEGRLKALLLERAVDNAATEHGAELTALKDSRTFQDAVADLDPDSKNYAEKVSTAVKAAVDKNPRLKATAPEPVTPSDAEAKADKAKTEKPKAGVSGSDITAGTGATPITEAQLKRMSPDEIAKAMSEGRLAHLL